METAKHTETGTAMVVLHKVDIQTRRFPEILSVIAFKEEASLIAMDFRLQHQHTGESGLDNPKRHHTGSTSRAFKYCP
jgi:hypothetical protein